MKNNFFNYSVANIYTKPLPNASVSSQILYGEKFKILCKKNKWLKIKTSFDNYIGYIKKIDKFNSSFKPKYKISKLRSRIFKKIKNEFLPTDNFLYFASGVSFRNQTKIFVEFEKNKWIKKKDLRKINHYEQDYVKIFKLFTGSRYLWGGKTAKGIDCSALVQIYFYYNRIFFPRDTRDQIKFCRKKLKRKIAKGDIIFWKGHVGVCVNSSKFIHAYGPRKKVIIMSINHTIKQIKNTASLFVKKISNIKNY